MRVMTDLCRELRTARTSAGLSQAVVARAAGISRSHVSRVERGLVRRLSILEIGRLLAIVGLELSARAFPSGDPIRDKAHIELLDRLVQVSSPDIKWRFEVPLEIPGDRRAWDAVGLGRTCRFGAEAETAPNDVQALQRKVALKKRDDSRVQRVIVVLANTRQNRAFLGQHRATLETNFPVAPKAMLAAISGGSDPGGDGILLL